MKMKNYYAYDRAARTDRFCRFFVRQKKKKRKEEEIQKGNDPKIRFVFIKSNLNRLIKTKL